MHNGSDVADLWLHSQDLNPQDFFFWGFMKSLVYETPMVSDKDFMARVIIVADKIKMTPQWQKVL